MKDYLRRLFQRQATSADAETAVLDETPPATSLRRSDLVEMRAFKLWKSEGCIPGRDVYYWLRAEEEIAIELGERQI
jgi:hypothetical protein